MNNYIKFLIATVIFILISFAYFAPDIFKGKGLTAGDVVQGISSVSEIDKHYNETGEESLWTNSMFGGMPSYQIKIEHKSSKPALFLKKASSLFLKYPADLIFLLLIGAFIMSLSLGAGYRIAIIGAIAYAFSSYFFIIIHAGHLWKLYTLAYIPPTFAGIIWAYRGKYLLGGIVSSIYLVLQILSNHPQMTYYFGLLVIIYLVGQFIHDLRNKTLARFFIASIVLVFAGAFSFAINSTNLYHSWQYSKLTIRGPSELTQGKQEGNLTGNIDRGYATDWSYGIGETFTLMIPDTKGGATGYLGGDKDAMENVSPQLKQNISQMNHYWGDQPFTEGPVYVGAFVIFLFILGLFIVKGYWKWVLLAGTILSIMLSWGKNFMWLTNLFLDYMPLYDKFRTVSSILVIAELAIPMLVIFTLIKLIENKSVLFEKKKELYISIGLSAGLTLLFIMIPSIFSFFSAAEIENFDQMVKANPAQAKGISLFMNELEKARISIFRADAWRSLFIIVLGVIAIFLYSKNKFHAKNNINSTIFLTLTALLVLGDMYLVNKRYLNNKDMKTDSQIMQQFASSAADEEIKKDKTLGYRVMNTTVSTFQDATTSMNHHSIGGYHAAKLRRYQDIIERYLVNRDMNVLNMLNTKYIIVADENKQPKVINNSQALGSAWFVDTLEWVNNADEEIASLQAINPKTTAYADKRFESAIPQSYNATALDSTSFISMTSYAPNYLVYESSSETDKLAVFSEIYYAHGWQAYIDGKELPIIRVNYILRAAAIPAGKHKIEFRFDPKSYHVTENLAYISYAILSLFVILALALSIIKSRNNLTKTKKHE